MQLSGTFWLWICRTGLDAFLWNFSGQGVETKDSYTWDKMEKPCSWFFLSNWVAGLELRSWGSGRNILDTQLWSRSLNMKNPHKAACSNKPTSATQFPRQGGGADSRNPQSSCEGFSWLSTWPHLELTGGSPHGRRKPLLFACLPSPSLTSLGNGQPSRSSQSSDTNLDCCDSQWTKPPDPDLSFPPEVPLLDYSNQSL